MSLRPQGCLDAGILKRRLIPPGKLLLIKRTLHQRMRSVLVFL